MYQSPTTWMHNIMDQSQQELQLKILLLFSILDQVTFGSHLKNVIQFQPVIFTKLIILLHLLPIKLMVLKPISLMVQDLLKEQPQMMQLQLEDLQQQELILLKLLNLMEFLLQFPNLMEFQVWLSQLSLSTDKLHSSINFLNKDKLMITHILSI